jgi:hypothetical protein
VDRFGPANRRAIKQKLPARAFLNLEESTRLPENLHGRFVLRTAPDHIGAFPLADKPNKINRIANLPTMPRLWHGRCYLYGRAGKALHLAFPIGLRRTHGEDTESNDESIKEFESVFKHIRRTSSGFGSWTSRARPRRAASSSAAKHTFFDDATAAVGYSSDHSWKRGILGTCESLGSQEVGKETDRSNQ